MILGIPSTGSAGLIQTVGMFSQGHIVAGVLGTVASTGWTIQGLGNAFYYRMVSPIPIPITTPVSLSIGRLAVEWMSLRVDLNDGIH